MKFEPISSHRARLGEGPHWSYVRNELLYVDVHNGSICAWKPGSEPRIRKVCERATFLIDTADGGLVFGTPEGLATLKDIDDETIEPLIPAVPVEANEPMTSVNDARCDPRGRLWFGTMDRDTARRPICGIYRWTKEEGLLRTEDGVQISNGIQWSPKGDVMYYVDSWKQRLDAFDYDIETGAISNRRTLAHIPKEDGLPDGMNVDSESRVYVALYGGGKIRRFLPDGRFDCDIELPVGFPTSMCFAGDDLKTMYITTSSAGYANTGLESRERRDDPDLRGAILMTELDVPGQATRSMAETFDQLPGHDKRV